MKTLRVTFKDGSQYDIPVNVIVDHCSSYCRKYNPSYFNPRTEDDWCEIEIADWATNNMNWSDVVAHAVQVKPPDKRDMDELWANAKTEVVNT